MAVVLGGVFAAGPRPAGAAPAGAAPAGADPAVADPVRVAPISQAAVRVAEARAGRAGAVAAHSVVGQGIRVAGPTNNPVRPPASGAYLGAWVNPAGGVTSAVTELGAYPAFEAQVKRPMSLLSVYQTWNGQAPNNVLLAIAYHGAIPFVSWDCGDSNANINLGADDFLIASYAQQLQQYGLPVLLRWYWEPNFPSSPKYNNCMQGQNKPGQAEGPAGYRAAWQRIFSIFQEVGATNVAFVFNPGAGGDTNLLPYYPGSAFVDWTGFDDYDRYPNNMGAFDTKLRGSYDEEEQLFPGKPMVMGEVGSINQPVFFNHFYGELVGRPYPDLKAIVYFDSISRPLSQNPGQWTLSATGIQQFSMVAATRYFANRPPPLPPTSCPAASSPTVAGSPVAIQSMSNGPCTGYWIATARGQVAPFGAAGFYGDLRSVHLNAAIVGMATTPDNGGYWLLGADGGIFEFGDAKFYGSTGNVALNAPIVGIIPSVTGRGYWLVASDGGIFDFGDAPFLGSTGNVRLNKPILGGAATGDGAGYWLVASDGGIFDFGDAPFFGSTGNVRLNKPIVGMTADPAGLGYRLVASDGGIFDFGSSFFGSLGNVALNSPIIGMSVTFDGNGYYMLGGDGGVFEFGTDASYFGRVFF